MSDRIIIDDINKNERLDKVLVKLWPELSRSLIQQAIKRGEILVNCKKAPVHHFLKLGEEIIWQNIPVNNKKIQAQAATNVKYEVIKETDDYLIINKPAGLVVHPGEGTNEPTLAEGLMNDYPEIAKVGDDPVRPGIVHRLDKEVSGLMMVARHQEAFDYFKTQFQKRLILKEYLALVVGNVSTPSGVIDFPLARSKKHHNKMAAKAEANDKTRDAITHYEVAKHYQQTTLLKIKLETGRTHQIRAHLNALGYPLVGDQLYRPKKVNFKTNPGRIFLHSFHLGFYDLSSTWVEYKIDLPKELDSFLKKLV